MIDELGQTYFERAKMGRGNLEREQEFLHKAVTHFIVEPFHPSKPVFRH